jgi:hypothetical protein
LDACFAEINHMGTIPLQHEQEMRPWIQLAAFCNIALQDTTGALSVIRIFDRYTIVGTSPEMPPSNIQMTLVIIFKSGAMVGNYTIGVRPVTPTGQQMPPMEFPGLFEGYERGVQVILPMGMLVQEQGLYWFDVLVDQQLFTRIPLRVMYQKIPEVPGALGTSPAPPSPQ